MQVEALVRLETSHGVAVITLANPSQRNALSTRVLEELLACLAAAEADTGVYAMLLAGDGSSFCSGLNLREAKDNGIESATHSLLAAMRAILASEKPVVARVHGAARAGGLGLIAAADIAVAAESVSFAFTEARIGVAPMAISLAVLPRLTSRAASAYFLTGEAFDAHEAERIGLVTQTVPDADLDSSISATLSALAAAIPPGLAETKKLLNEPTLERFDSEGPALAARSARLFESPAALDAMRSFLSR